MKTLDSPVFGKTFLLDPEEENYKILKYMIDRFPVNAFGIVNKKLNFRGFTCKIMTTKEAMEEQDA